MGIGQTSLRRHLPTNNDLISGSSMRALAYDYKATPVMQTASLQITLPAPPPGVGVRIKCACEIQYQQLIWHASRLSTLGDAQTTEAACTLIPLT